MPIKKKNCNHQPLLFGESGKNKRAAVKIVNDGGIESLKIVEIG